MLGMGFVENWQTLAALRAILGIFEAALFPGAVYLLSSWYPRHETQKRMSAFYAVSIVASGLSSILAYGLSFIKMHKNQGWRSIFIIEGIITMVLGVAGILLIVDFPDKAKFLNETQRKMVLTRIERDRADAAPDAFTWAKFFSYVLDIKLWACATQFFAATLGSYSLSYFLPTILRSMGFSVANSQILVAPPYVWALIPALTSAYFSDKTCVRTPFIAFSSVMTIVGTCLYSYSTTPAARYAGVFLAVGGCNTTVPLVIGYSQINIRAQTKRAYTSALVVGCGGIGGIAAALTFTQKQAPKYSLGVEITLAFNVLCIVICAIQHVAFRIQNKRADAGKVILENDESFRYQL